VWLVNRRVAGIYIRRNNAGLATDWEYAGDYPVNSVNGQSGNVVLGASSVGADPANFQIRAANYTAAVGDKVAADTTAGAFTLTLPATPSNGDTITVLDYAGTFDTNNLTIARNGSNIESLAEDLTCNVEDAAFTLVFVGSTVGWKVVPYFGNKTNFASPDPIGSSVPNTGRFTTLTANNGTLTGASAPALDVAQTWNASGTTFTGLNLALTNTASASASSYFNINLDAGQVFSIRRGESTTPATIITCGGSGLTWTARTRTGGGVGVNFSGVVGVGTSLQFGTGTGTGNGDIILSREAANILAQSNGLNAQTFRIYGTYTDASNYERGFVRWSAAGGNFEIGTEGAGTGSGRHMTLRAGANTFTFFNNGEFSSPTSIRITSRMVINSSASGVVAIRNDAGNDFNRLQFGGTDANFPALKRSSTALQVRLADDSGDAPLSASLFSVGSGAFDGVIGRPNAGVIGFARADGATTYIASLGFDGTNRAFVLNSGAFISWSTGNPTSVGGDLRMFRSGAGILRLQSDTSDFNRIQFGGTTTSFPALKRSGTMLQARLADDSGFATFDGILAMEGTAPATTGATGTAGELRYDANFIYVCTAANTWKRAAIATW
jgi:hypothetical protein